MSLMKIEIVEFESGKWAVRKRFLWISVYLDTTKHKVTWDEDYYIKKYCLLSSKAEAEELIKTRGLVEPHDKIKKVYKV